MKVLNKYAFEKVHGNNSYKCVSIEYEGKTYQGCISEECFVDSYKSAKNHENLEDIIKRLKILLQNNIGISNDDVFNVNKVTLTGKNLEYTK